MWEDYPRCITCQENALSGVEMALGHTRPQRPHMAGKSGTNCGSQWNTCGGTTIDAKLDRKGYLVLWKWPKNGPFRTKMPFWHCGVTTLDAKIGKNTKCCGNGQFWAKTVILAIGGQGKSKWIIRLEQMVEHIVTHVEAIIFVQNLSEKCTYYCEEKKQKWGFSSQKLPFLAIQGWGVLKSWWEWQKW